ncbi:MAG: V-type ATP synthase subunit I [Clostridiaceae bacterium]|nr:V-type ATP synthase subunit I [Clostridiaceae bacterium]
MIVKMSRLTITGLMEERSAIVRRLMKLGIVQLDKIPLTDEQLQKALEDAQFDDSQKRIAEIDEELRKISSAITFLSENAPSGKTKHTKTDITFDKFVDHNTYSGVWEKVFAANDLNKRLNNKKSEYSALQNELQFLKVWEGLEIPVELTETSATKIITGTIPASADIDTLHQKAEQTGVVSIAVLGSDKDQSYINIIAHNSVVNEIEEQLKSCGFAKANFGGRTGTISANIENTENNLKKTQADIDRLVSTIGQKYDNLPDICRLYDYIYNMQQRRRVRMNFLTTQKAFIVGGWVPTDSAQRVKQEIEQSFNVFVTVTEPEKDEQTPILLKNNSLVYPFEMITEMYSLPTSNGIDPNPAMAPFYWFFFGIMLGDAAYGLLLTVLCTAAIWYLKTEKGTMMDKMLKMLALCGISTLIFGAAFGSWFGDLLTSVFGITVPPLWFDPNKDPIKLMVWSFIFGSVHLLAGMAVNAYMLIRDGKWLSAIFDIGLWYVVLIGVGLLFLGGNAANIGKNMIIYGFIGLVLTQGRHEKNIIKKFTSGLLSLYNITGYLSDVLSYSRLLALGLATGVIAQVINQLGMLPGGFSNLFSAIALIVILIGGHLFNMSINVLGAYVHSSRLQYVEFFGKFYESGGEAFSPLKPKLKYLKIKSN